MYVITDLEIGGVPLHLHRLIKAMRERGYESSVVSLATPGPVTDLLHADGVKVYSCDGRGGLDFRVPGRLSRFFQQIEPDIIHSLLFHANIASRWSARKIGFPKDRVICEIQTVEVERKWHLWVDGWTYKGCRFTIGNSPSVINHLAAKAGIAEENLRLVRGGIDPNAFRDVQAIDRSTLGVLDGAPMILWAGRFDPVKGLDFLIDAFYEVSRQSDAHLVLAGDGPTRAQMLDRIHAISMEDRVHCLGSRDDVPSLLKTADLFVFPSRTEGLPNALLEAMSSKCPIVTTDVPGCRDLIQHESNGLLVSYDDTQALTDAMMRMLKDRVLADLLADCAYQSVVDHWHIDQTYNRYAEIYRELMALVG